MHRLAWLWIIVAAIVTVGCGSSSAVSTINADGTWNRVVKLTTRDMPSMGDDKAQAPELFSVPTGSEWSKSEEKTKDGRTTTLKRTLKVGEGPITDVIIKDKSGTRYKNYVIVRKLEGNRLEYYEKIVLIGDPKPRSTSEANDFRKEMRAALPAGLATDADLDAIAKKSEVAITRLLFGPDDHLLGSFLLNLDGAVHRIRNRMGGIEDRLLSEQFGSRLSEADRRKTVNTLLAKLDDSNMLDSKKPSPNQESDDSQSGMIGMSVAVKLPGKLVSTNGEVDTYSGEVFWDFMSSSAEPDTLELRAICQL